MMESVNPWGGHTRVLERTMSFPTYLKHSSGNKQPDSGGVPHSCAPTLKEDDKLPKWRGQMFQNMQSVLELIVCEEAIKFQQRDCSWSDPWAVSFLL